MKTFARMRNAYRLSGVARAALTLVCLVGLGSCASGQTGKALVTETHLPNGLTVLTKEVHAVPVVCTYVWYHVGSRDEVPGITGVSHQLEHMMFKGTKKEFPQPGYIDLLVGRHGGENNAFTNTDYTAYYLLLPSDQLDLALRIEADRMTEAAIDPKQLTAEKRVVLSELDMDNNDNASFLYDNTRATAYQYHPYHYPVIGTRWDVEHFTRDQVYHYYRLHYAPNNATLVIVGDFETPKLLARIRQLWMSVQPSNLDEKPVNPEPPQRGERRIIVRRAGAVTYLECMYHIPAATHPDLAPLTVLATALSGGRSSRLYRALVEHQLATAVNVSANQGKDPEVFDISVTERTGVAPDAVEKAMLAEIARVQQEPLSANELQKAKNQARADFVYAQDSLEQQASRLGFYETITGDWQNLYRFLDQINAVTASDVRRVAQTYLTELNRTIGTFLPTGETPAPGSDAGGGHVAHYKPVTPRVSLANKGREFALDSPSPAAWKPVPETFGKGLGGEGRSVREGVGGKGHVGVRGNKAETTATQERKLSNGLTVIVRENHANPTVSLSGFVRVGSVNDPPGRFGLANFTAEMLTRGTTTHTSQQIAELTDFVGASLDANAVRERTDFGARMLSENFDSIFALLAECLRHPTFPADEVEKLRGEILNGLEEEANDTATVALRRLYAALYAASNPYCHAPDGTIDDVKQITRDDLTAFYQRAYRPERTTLVIVGDVKPDAAFAAAEKAFGDWHGTGEALVDYMPPVVTPTPPSAAPIQITLPDKDQDDIAMGELGLARSDKDYEAASLMNLILGGDEFVGRVGKRVRDTEGLAYYAYTAFIPGLEEGPWLFRAGVSPTNITHALSSTREEVVKMETQGVTDAELAWAKDHAIGALRLSLATNAGMAEQLANDAFYHLGLDYTDRYPQIVHALTKAQLDAAARKYLRPNDLAIVIAGPPISAASPMPAANSKQ